MCKIHVNGEVILVSKEDYIFLVGYTWSGDGRGYALGFVEGKQCYMHRVIASRMDLDLSNQIDHIDRDPRNNRRENLRSATRSQNFAWGRKKNPQSGYRGVEKHGKKYRARITVDYREIKLGTFDLPEEAHEAYCVAAKYYFGEFANTTNT